MRHGKNLLNGRLTAKQDSGSSAPLPQPRNARKHLKRYNAQTPPCMRSICRPREGEPIGARAAASARGRQENCIRREHTHLVNEEVLAAVCRGDEAEPAGPVPPQSAQQVRSSSGTRAGGARVQREARPRRLPLGGVEPLHGTGRLRHIALLPRAETGEEQKLLRTRSGGRLLEPCSCGYNWGSAKGDRFWHATFQISMVDLFSGRRLMSQSIKKRVKADGTTLLLQMNVPADTASALPANFLNAADVHLIDRQRRPKQLRKVPTVTVLSCHSVPLSAVSHR